MIRKRTQVALCKRRRKQKISLRTNTNTTTTAIQSSMSSVIILLLLQLLVLLSSPSTFPLTFTDGFTIPSKTRRAIIATTTSRRRTIFDHPGTTTTATITSRLFASRSQKWKKRQERKKKHNKNDDDDDNEKEEIHKQQRNLKQKRNSQKETFIEVIQSKDLIQKEEDEEENSHDHADEDEGDYEFENHYDYNDDEEDQEDDDDEDYIDEGQTYRIDYDDVIDVEHDPITSASSSSSTSYVNNNNYYDDTSYARDEDDILTEREDRLYIDHRGESTKVEKCILVAVEDVSALRRDRYNARKKLMMEMDGEQQQQQQQQNMYNQKKNNPEEWEVYFTLEESMNEMKDLIRTCGLELVGEVTQRLNEVNPKTFIGTGKVKETQALLEELDSATVVFDAELTPGQQKSLENAFNKEVMQNDFMGSEQLVRNVI